MKAMIFAAGRGERMRPLTDTCPKPLLKVRGRPLIVWHILNLVRAGITEIVINHAHLGQMIEDALGDGSRFGAQLRYSPEATALETAGAIAQARQMLGEDPFIAIASDIYSPHFSFDKLLDVLQSSDVWGNPYPPDKRDQAWIILARNPPYHPLGDFALNSFAVSNHGEPKYNFAGIGVYRPELFDGIQPGEVVKLGALLRAAADRGQLGGDLYRGEWANLGTLDDLAQVNAPFTPPLAPGLPS